MSKKSASPLASLSVEPMFGGECAAELSADLAKVLPEPQSLATRRAIWLTTPAEPSGTDTFDVIQGWRVSPFLRELVRFHSSRLDPQGGG